MTTPSPRGYPRHSGIGDVMPTEPDKGHWSYDSEHAKRFNRDNRYGGSAARESRRAVARAAMLNED